jgi:two-component system cell cycle sensor histidine kinase/response regulator CckA
MAPRILLVEDEVAVRSIAARALRSEGYEVVEAPDGLQAWKLAKESPFDLLVTDSRMPHLSGTQLAALVRELHPTIPILRISGSPGSGSAGMLRGMATLFKPFKPDGLVAAVRSLLAS